MAVTYENVELVGVDVAEVQVAYATRAAEDMGVKNAKFVVGDVNVLSQAFATEEKFDAILAVGIIHHLPNPVKGWKELVSLLRPGGIMRSK
jgi:2-polyprenyl-3-methyl-5-hydroxy-6-metoxy-1,4-benzoquinol methylase